MRFIRQIPGILAALTACLTVCSLPWLLGGVIPLARYVLLVGALISGVLSLLSQLCEWRLPRSVPAVLIPLIGLVLLGTVQLRSVDESPVSAIQHGLREPPAFRVTQPSASMIPADTRSQVSTLLSVAILASVCFDQIRRPISIAICSSLLLLNGIALCGVGVGEMFHQNSLAFIQEWTLSGRDPFATFINPNNAAGWLCLSFSMAVGWLAYQLRAARADTGSMGALQLPLLRRVRHAVLQFVADLTAWQILSLFAVAFLAAGVAATRSRGGILALIVGVVLVSLFASRVRRLPLTLLVVAVCCGVVYLLLQSLDLGQGIALEMRTLRDLDAAAGSRPRHWLDSLTSLADFPLTGTGLGSYRFATLPYQSEYSDLWFRNADNHFVDMAVEGGLIGVSLFIGVGVLGILTGAAAWRRSRKAKSDGLSRPVAWGLGTGVLLAIFTQATSGFFDYGIGMPAASALLVILISIAAGCLDHHESRPSLVRSGSMAVGPMIALSVQLCLISAGLTYWLDQRAATDIDKSVVQGTRLLAHPVSVEDLDEVDSARQVLEQRLRRRPDDSEGLWMLTRLADAEFRWQVMLSENGDAVRDLAGFDMTWQKYTVLLFAERMAEFDAINPQESKRIRSQINDRLKASGLSDCLRTVQEQFPLMPNIAEARAEVGALKKHDESIRQQIEWALFAEPSNAETGFRLGRLALKYELPELCIRLWQDSARLSPQFQSAVMIAAGLHWSPEEAMRLFGPTAYESCVQVAQECPSLPLRKELYDRAETLWPAVEVNDDRVFLRARHLSATSRRPAAITLLQSQVQTPGDHLRLRRQLAVLLEKEGVFTESLAEWQTILYLEPGDPSAISAIDRLRKLGK